MLLYDSTCPVSLTMACCSGKCAVIPGYASAPPSSTACGAGDEATLTTCCHLGPVPFPQVQKALIDMENMFELLATVPGVLDVKGATSLQVRDGQVDFQGVVFGYDAAQPVLKGVNLTAVGGSTLAVVGSTGSGKSTILR